MRRPGILLAGNIIASAIVLSMMLVISDTSIIDNMLNEGGVFEGAATELAQLTPKLAVALYTPHLVMFGLGALFGWLGYGTRVRGLTLTSGILYCVALVLMVSELLSVILPLIFSFVGFSQQGRIATEYAEAEAKKQHEYDQWERYTAEMDRSRMSTEDLLEQLAQRNRAAQAEEPSELPPVQKRERSENESEEDRLSRLGTQARKWHEENRRY